MLERIRVTPWRNYPQPEWNIETSVADALVSVCQASDGNSSSAAYDKLLYAVGNNHAGTYYPVLLAVMPFLEEVLRLGEPWPTRTVLCTLGDLFGTFQPEVGHESATHFPGNCGVAQAFSQSVLKLSPILGTIARSCEFNAELATEILGLVNERGA